MSESIALAPVLDAPKPRIQDNFYQHVNHDWLNDPKNQIPDEYPRWGGFIKLHDDGLKNQIQLTKDLENKENKTEEEEKVYAIWKAVTTLFDNFSNNVGNYNPIVKELNALDAFMGDDNDRDLITRVASYLFYTQVNGISNVMDFDKGSDLENTNNVVLDFQCGTGLSLPSREYYTEDNFAEKREQFREHLQNVVKLLNNNELDNEFVNNVIEFESDISNFCMKAEQQRRYDEYYTNTTLEQLYQDVNNLRSLDDKYEDGSTCQLNDDQIEIVGKFMENLYESFQFRERLSANLQKNYLDANVENPPNEYHVTAYDGDCIRRVLLYILDPNNLAKYKSYLQYKIISSCQQYCTRELYEEFFDFYNRKLGGQKEMKSVEKRSINIVNAFAGEMLGKIYVDRFFPSGSKEDVLHSINEVLGVMRESMKTNDWLTDETKQNALKKLDKFRVKIGYPDVWKDYSKFNVIVGDSLYVISKKAKQWSLQIEFYDKLNSVLDRNEWHMTPQTVNAYFSPTQNEIVFPAAILQPPFYCRSADDIDFNIEDEKNYNSGLLAKATNFGGIGAVIAHEITHGYDDQGRKFDCDGNLNDWWTKEDETLFKSKTELMAAQAAKYQFIDTLDNNKEYGMNAQLTMGENLADLGGMSLSLKALQNHLADNNVNNNSDTYNAYLRVFFKSFANIWKQNSKKDFLIKQLTTDPHAPSDFRGNSVKNIDAFYDVFNVKEGDGMYVNKEERVVMY